ncbi:hypothetical protein AMS68_003815 [Peltaster fructicola]|uniref:Glycosyl transferase family 17 protein n=1 Tax=Peltaster fructicola TaxID=286661 RepID=A0A6H0XUK9_9PEZI|nr:hypothetical protein AMS68_003815 [Peltaster fructicola]
MPLLRRLQKYLSLKVLLLILFALILLTWPHRSVPSQRAIQSGHPLFANLNPAKPHKSTSEAADAVCRAHDFSAWHKPGRKVYDLAMISNELDWLEIRLHTLSSYVDYFVVVEANVTFTGQPKPLHLQENWQRFKQFHHKIIHRVLADDTSSRYIWDHEAYFRNALLTSVFPKLAGTEQEAHPGDVLIVGDMDEIVRPETAMLLRYCDFPPRLNLRSQFYYYAYQWQHRGEQWSHPQATTFGKDVKHTLLPETLRMNLLDSSFSPLAAYRRWRDQATLWNAGWHCSFCFTTLAEMQDKMAAFSHQGLNTPENRNPATIIERVQKVLTSSAEQANTMIRSYG